MAMVVTCEKKNTMPIKKCKTMYGKRTNNRQEQSGNDKGVILRGDKVVESWLANTEQLDR